MSNHVRKTQRDAQRAALQRAAFEKREDVWQWQVRTAELCREWAVDQTGWRFHGYVTVLVLTEHVRDGWDFRGYPRFCPLWEAFRAAGFDDVFITDWTVGLDGIAGRLPPVITGTLPFLRPEDTTAFAFECPVIPPLLRDYRLLPESVRWSDGEPLDSIPF